MPSMPASNGSGRRRRTASFSRRTGWRTRTISSRRRVMIRALAWTATTRVISWGRQRIRPRIFPRSSVDRASGLSQAVTCSSRRCLRAMSDDPSVDDRRPMTDEGKPSAESGPIPSAPDKPLVRVQGIHKRFGLLHVLKGIDLDVRAGEKVSIIGPSGSGKTTLLRCINYIEKPSQGHIYVNGHLIGEKAVDQAYVALEDRALARQRAEIGMVLQRFNLFPHLTVSPNIEIGPVKVLKS